MALSELLDNLTLTAPSDNPPPTNSSFLRLPTELRLMVYDHLLAADLPSRHPSILSICQLIRNEAEPILYDTTTTFHLREAPHDYIIQSPLNRPLCCKRLKNKFWHFARYIQANSVALRKFKGIKIFLPTLEVTSYTRGTPVPIDGLLYILGSLLEGSTALRTLEIVQEVENTSGKRVKRVDRFGYENAPFFYPRTTIICSGFTATTIRKMERHAISRQKDIPTTNVLLPWVRLKIEIRELFELLAKAKVQLAGSSMLWAEIMEAENRCADLVLLRKEPVPTHGKNLIEEEIRTSCVQEALEGPLEELSAYMRGQEVREAKASAFQKLANAKSLSSVAEDC